MSRRVPDPPHMFVLASSGVLLPRGGTRCERRTTSGPERASLLAPGGNSIRPADPAVATFTELRVFLPTLHLVYTGHRWRSDQPRSIGATPLHYGIKPHTHRTERERDRKGGRGEERKQDLEGWRTARISPEKPKRRYHGAVGDSRARERAVSERRCNKLTGSNWLSYNVTSQFAEFSREARGRIYVK